MHFFAARCSMARLRWSFLVACAATVAPAQGDADGRPPTRLAPAACPAFVPNVGQWPDPGTYRATIGPVVAFLTADGWTLRFAADSHAGVVIAMRMVAAAPAAMVCEQRLPGVHNYFLGNEPATWRTNVPRYGAVRWQGVQPGIDVLVHARRGIFEYDVELAAGAALPGFELEVAGADALELTADGAMELRAGGESLRQTAPRAYTIGADGAQEAVAVAFELRGGTRFGFVVPSWDGTRTLVIDPGIVWSTYVGGTAVDRLNAVAVDDLGRTTVAGETGSANFPVTVGVFQPVASTPSDVCVSRFDPSLGGTAQLSWSTFVGGSGTELATDLLLEPNGIVTVTGMTGSANFPLASAFDTTRGGTADAFLLRLDPSLGGAAQLRYSSYFGGSAYDAGQRVRRSATGITTLIGVTQSTDLPTTANAYDPTFHGSTDTFVARFDLALPPAQQLSYATYIGGAQQDSVIDATIDGGQRVVFAGQTTSTDFPTSANALLPSYRGGLVDGFVGVLDPALAPAQQLVYSTYLGGANSDRVDGLALDASGRIAMTGSTGSGDFPTTAGAYSNALNTGLATPDSDAFVTLLDPTLAPAQQVVWSTYFGATANEWGRGLTIDSTGVVTLMGLCSVAPNVLFPTTPGAYETSHTPARQCTFVARLDPQRSTAAQLRHSTLLANGQDQMQDMALHADGSVTLAGATVSITYPTTPGAFQPTHTVAASGQLDGIVTRLDLLPTGVTRYGTATSSCVGEPRADVDSLPALGNAGFTIFGAGVPPGSPGLLGVAGGGLTAPLPLLGFQLWIDPALLLSTVGLLADAHGSATVGIPIPATPPLVGYRLDTQYVWLGTGASPSCPPLGFAASKALAIVIQP